MSHAFTVYAKHFCFRAAGLTGLALALTFFSTAGTPCAAQQASPSTNPLLGRQASGASPGAIEAGSSPVVALLPQAAHAPAPAWVKPGLRLTFHIAVASVPGHGKDWQINSHGDMVDTQGNRWQGTDKIGVGGHGYNQYDVVAQEGPKIALVHTNFMFVVNEPLAPVSQVGMLGPTSTGGDLWVNPAMLKLLTEGMHGGVQVSRSPYKIGDTNRAAVWIHQGGRAGSTMYVYDEKTGVLLHFSSVAQGKGSPVIAPDETENTGNTLLAQTTLADQRMLNLPWMGDALSEWTTRVAPLSYQGAVSTLTPGSTIGPIRQPLMESITPQAHGTDWALFGASIHLGQPDIASQQNLVWGAAQIGSLWISPGALARLQPGQELDRDPVTKFVTRVGKSGRMADGREAVTISLTATGFQINYSYDRNQGNLIAFEEVEQHSYVTKRTTMLLKSAR